MSAEIICSVIPRNLLDEYCLRVTRSRIPIGTITWRRKGYLPYSNRSQLEGVSNFLGGCGKPSHSWGYNSIFGLATLPLWRRAGWAKFEWVVMWAGDWGLNTHSHSPVLNLRNTALETLWILRYVLLKDFLAYAVRQQGQRTDLKQKFLYWNQRINVPSSI